MKKPSTTAGWVAGAVAVVTSVALARALYPDLRRYWKIRTM